MPASDGRVPLDRLRAAVEGGIRARSLRSVAREVGMSPSGLQKFRDGATPYTSTRQKLERWYLREAAREGDLSGVVPARAALQLLTSGLPEGQRREAVAGIIDLLDTIYREQRLRPPAWLVELRASHSGGETEYGG